jgi:hypothetical protein
MFHFAEGKSVEIKRNLGPAGSSARAVSSADADPRFET